MPFIKCAILRATSGKGSSCLFIVMANLFIGGFCLSQVGREFAA